MSNLLGVLGVLSALLALSGGHLTLALILLVGVIILGYSSGGRMLLASVHGGDLRFVAEHEAGHVIVAEEGGGTVTKVRANSDGGYVKAIMTDQDPIDVLAFYYAGSVAVDSSEGAEHDFGEVEKVLQRMPRESRSYYRKRGMIRANEIVRGNQRRIHKIADRIERTGTL